MKQAHHQRIAVGMEDINYVLQNHEHKLGIDINTKSVCEKKPVYIVTQKLVHM